MNAPFGDKEFDRILNAPFEIVTLDQLVDDAKRRLSQSRFHSAIVAAVGDRVACLAREERRAYHNDEIYPVLALELLRHNETLMRQLTREWTTRVNPPVITWPTCPKPHYEAKTWWQRVCLKLGGFK